MIHGKDIKIFNSAGTALIAAAKSCAIHKSGDVLEKASASSPTEREFEPGRTAWSIDLAYLVTTGTDGMLLVGTKYLVKVAVSNSVVLQGYAICTTCDIQATMGNLASGSIKMQGTGALAPPTS